MSRAAFSPKLPEKVYFTLNKVPAISTCYVSAADSALLTQRMLTQHARWVSSNRSQPGAPSTVLDSRSPRLALPALPLMRPVPKVSFPILFDLSISIENRKKEEEPLHRIEPFCE